MKNSSIFLIVALLTIAILVYTFKKKIFGDDTEEESDLRNEPVVFVPIPPPSPPVNDSGVTIPVDTRTGEGLVAISDMAKSLMSNDSFYKGLKESSAVGLDLFPITRSGVSEEIRNVFFSNLPGWGMTNKISTESGVKLIPEFVDNGVFVGKLKSLKKELESISNISKNKTEYFEAFKRLDSDFMNESNFRLFAENPAAYLGAYGECKGGSNRKEECNEYNRKKLAGREMIAVVDAFLSETARFGILLKDYSINELKKSGWKFI